MTTNEQAEYTPTTGDVRAGFSAKPYLVMPQGPAESFSEYLGRLSIESMQCQILSGEAFDRWLAGERHRVACETLKWAADRLERSGMRHETAMASGYLGAADWLSGPALEGHPFVPAVGGSTPAVDGEEGDGPKCGAPAEGGPCVLPRAHNMGQLDVPSNHRAAGTWRAGDPCGSCGSSDTTGIEGAATCNGCLATDYGQPPAVPDSLPLDPEPCRCLKSFAYVTPTHEGHCCFLPESQTCHPEEVAAWEARRDESRYREGAGE